MRILFINDYLPYPLISGDRIRVYNLVRRMARQHAVTFMSFIQSPGDVEGLPLLEEVCERVEAIPLPRRPRLARVPRMTRFMLAGIPPDLEFLYSEEMVGKIREAIAAEDFDLVHFEQTRMALYLSALPTTTRAKKVLGLQNVAALQYARLSQIELTLFRRMRAWLHSRMMQRWEANSAELFDLCTTVSGEDRDRLLEANPRVRVDLVPNGVDTRLSRLLAQDDLPKALLLVGSMSYVPSADGAIWFCSEVLPHVRQEVGEVEVWIVGHAPPPQVEVLAGDGVHVTGRVEDVVPYYERSAVSIVPIRGGSGTRLKILEAMALGRPVVSTSIGCDGLDVVPGEHLLVADSAQEFARETVRLLADASLRQRIVVQARALVESAYDWDAITERMLAIYTALVQERG